jgi:hypothetical protein
MPGLLGYMLAIVVMLGGYFAGLNWLLNPPDPWQPNPRIVQVNAQQPARKRPPPIVKPAEAETVSTSPDAALASIETVGKSTRNQADANAMVQPAALDVVEAPRRAEVSRRVEASRPVEASRRSAEPSHIARRDDSQAGKPAARKRIATRSTGRKLELMVLRTYERSDGVRFTRLLPMSSTRSAMAFQPDDQW